MVIKSALLVILAYGFFLCVLCVLCVKSPQEMDVTRNRVLVASMILLAAAIAPRAQVSKFTPVTKEMLENPSPDDWLMYSRTYDAQRFSPLKQITRANIGQLKTAWTHELGMGTVESIPLVYRGVMYVVVPGAGVRALDAIDGAVIWEYKRAGNGRPKTIAMYDDLIFYTAPDSTLVALDARTGAVRWETKTAGGATSGAIVVEGKVLTGRTCSPQRANCYVAAHDAKTGKEVWKFYTAAGDDDPGGKTWGGAPEATVLGYGIKVPAPHAALVNGTMARAQDYDAFHERALVHITAGCLPQCLAIAERRGRVTGKEFISAMVAGMEFMIRLGVSLETSFLHAGRVTTLHQATFGGALAGAKLLNLDRRKIVSAPGLAYSQVSGKLQVAVEVVDPLVKPPPPHPMK